MKNSHEIKRKLAESLELPKDIILDIPKITMIGDIRMNIENHKGIIEYTNNCIRIKIKDGILKIMGKNLLLKIILKDEIVIIGKIQQVEFTL